MALCGHLARSFPLSAAYFATLEKYYYNLHREHMLQHLFPGMA